MNRKIFKLITENLQSSFNLPKFAEIRNTINKDTVVLDLPWTPARLRKFREHIESTLDLKTELAGTVEQITADLSNRYTGRFFGEIWQPNTDRYTYSGWRIIEELSQHSPKTVLDVGCGYNQFKPRVPGLVGIDPYNNCADYQVDILDFASSRQFDAMLVLGSINFNSRDEIQQRISKCVELLVDGGRMYFRVNPGQTWPKGPWVDIFDWDFKTIQEFADEFNLELETFKKDYDRYYFVYLKK